MTAAPYMTHAPISPVKLLKPLPSGVCTCTSPIVQQLSSSWETRVLGVRGVAFVDTVRLVRLAARCGRPCC